MNRTRPNIYDFQDAIEFLISSYEFEQSRTQDLSLRKWSKIIDIDAQNLILIFKKKKKLSLAQSIKISLVLNLDSKETSYFEAMIKYTYEDSEKEKRLLRMVLLELRQHTGRTVMVEDQSVFSHWVHMAIISMSKVDGFRCTQENIRDFLCDEVSQEIIDDSIERLLKLKLITQDEKGCFKKNYDNTTSKNDAYKKSPHQYFEQVAELAKKGAHSPAEEREFQCFSLAIKHEQIPMFKEMIRNFRGKVCDFAEKENSDQVYQFNIQFFPLTKRQTQNSLKTVTTAMEVHI